MNVTTKNTLIEASKIVGKLLLGAVILLTTWYVFTQGYLWLGFSQIGAEAMSWATIFVPFLIFGVGQIIWSEAKLRVWKRENNVE